jgi:hypothetical protein
LIPIQALAQPLPLYLAALGLLLVLVGELYERRLFFSAMSSARMPGGLA